ncbi:uncharacterized protein LOC121727444 [Aricia agestis]|uniref:uncharacterized protein LOC121727444 n=1 Tax=Aricia agestis TaxID=91739 RepID=UPI001C208B93|nr:uncharacterized protein LOC121727444 [Aricia agestis]
MIANLPLLFANGHPTALSKITASELEKFITFMVTCSWGHDTAKDIRQPPWWTNDVSFSHPFKKPFTVPSDWEARLKNLVKKCYDYHKSAFLLVFSAQLARYPRNRLRYVDNRDHTTSLYYRPSGRLLVTFRNENIFYDRDESLDTVEQIKSADIYLCDNCDSHFDNLDVLKAHERLCNNESIPSSSCNGGLPEFLSALKLRPSDQAEEDVHNKNKDIDAKTRSIRTSANYDRGPPYPFSSLAYTKNVKTNCPRDTSYSRERIERYCCTSTVPLKHVASKSKSNQFPVRYRRPSDYWQRKYVHPQHRNKKVLDLNGQLLFLKCRPISVPVERMSLEKINEYIDNLKKESERKRCLEDKDIVYVDGLDSELVDADVKICDPLKRFDTECEVIDLCSDDESPIVNENCDPRAGVTCVMKGGAVLRRTAATPQALPAEPCGAREKPLPSLILQPHPVILITHTLNNLSSIALN